MQRPIQTFPQRPGKGKSRKYLLKTWSFPHSPQTFPQDFSTGGHKGVYTKLLSIKRPDSLRQNLHFFSGCGFAHRGLPVDKFGA
jgi:hypothetical protein